MADRDSKANHQCRARGHRVASIAAAVVLGVLLPAPAGAAPGQNCAEPGRVRAERPWPRAMLAIDETARIATGGGVTVAVLATGVDADQSQLGQVAAGADAVAAGGTAGTDCAGIGTRVAGVIAARPGAGNGVTGLARDARVLPVRVVPDDPAGEPQADPADLSRGVTLATDGGADVIVVAIPAYRDSQALRAAVARAVARGALVVAAAGDRGAAGDGNPTPYPAAYRDVLGVGAIMQNGQLLPGSQRGDHVDLVAPGGAVPTLQPGGGAVEADGTALAAGFVGAAAALLRATNPDRDVREIARVLLATASPAPIGDAYGAGVVNAYAAITGQVPDRDARPLPRLASAARPAATDTGTRDAALLGAGIAALAVAGVLTVGAALRRSRHRRWRPGMPPALAKSDEPVEPGPPVMLLDGTRLSG